MPHLPFGDGGSRAWPAIKAAQFIFCTVEDVLTVFGQSSSTSVDVEVQHGHGRLEGRAFAPLATVGRAFQGSGDTRRTLELENTFLQIERIATLRHVLGPASRRRRPSRFEWTRHGMRLAYFFTAAKASSASLRCSCNVGRVFAAKAFTSGSVPELDSFSNSATSALWSRTISSI